MLQPKDKNWLNRLKKKKKTPIYAVYKRPTSNLGAHADWKQRIGKRHSMQMEAKGKQEYQYSYQIKYTLKQRLL